MFFWQEDKRFLLKDRIQQLDNLIFHEKLGTMHDKMVRMQKIGRLLSLWVPHANLLSVEQAIGISKTDLLTKTVIEFPNLQGTIGYHLALNEEIDDDIALAIKDQYQPKNIKDEVTTSPISIVLSLSDKFDNIISMFLIDELPTSSKDPYALRRAALGIIKTIIQNKISLQLSMFIERALKYYDNIIKKKHSPLKILFGKKEIKESTKQDLITYFIVERLRFYLIKMSYDKKYVDAIIDNESIYDIYKIYLKISTIQQYFATRDPEHCILYNFKRIDNILSSNQESYIAEDIKHSTSSEEAQLIQNLSEYNEAVSISIKNNDLLVALDNLLSLSKNIEQYFQNHMINTDDMELRKHRLSILYQIRKIYLEVCNFSHLDE